MIGASLAEIEPSGDDGTYGGIFTTEFPRRTTRPVFPTEFIHINDKQDEFDWNLAKVSFN